MRNREVSRAFMPYPDSVVHHSARGLLQGLSFAVKDFFDVAGYPTSGGNPVMLAQSGIKMASAQVVCQLLHAGAHFVGKTVCDEMGFSINGQNAHFGNPVNGAAPDRMSGGSSSGSASAVSLGLCDFAIGTDTGGSVRVPASHCGLIGLRTSHGRVSLQGAMPMAQSFDSCGWLAKDIDCFDKVSSVLLGQDARPLDRQLTVVIPQEVLDMLDAQVRQAVWSALEQAVTVFDRVEQRQAFSGFQLDELFHAFRHLQGFEAWQTHGGFIETFQPPLGAGVAQRFAWAKTVTADQVQAALDCRRAFQSCMAERLGRNTVLLMPTMPDIAPSSTADAAALDLYRSLAMKMLCIAGLTGFPQISLPLATRLDAPLGVSLLGPPGSDRQLVSLARDHLWPVARDPGT